MKLGNFNSVNFALSQKHKFAFIWLYIFALQTALDTLYHIYIG